MKHGNLCLFVLFSLCFLIFILLRHRHYNRSVTAADPISDVCLGCIFSAMSDLRCQGECGLFKVTRVYWSDAGRPTVKHESPDSPHAFKNCTSDLDCAAATVTSYLTKFAQDCNDDGIINCNDYMALHVLGGQSCSEARLLPRRYVADFNHCTDVIGL